MDQRWFFSYKALVKRLDRITIIGMRFLNKRRWMGTNHRNLDRHAEDIGETWEQKYTFEQVYHYYSIKVFLVVSATRAQYL